MHRPARPAGPTRTSRTRWLLGSFVALAAFVGVWGAVASATGDDAVECQALDCEDDVVVCLALDCVVETTIAPTATVPVGAATITTAAPAPAPSPAQIERGAFQIRAAAIQGMGAATIAAAQATPFGG